jgi:predicted nucleic acid-binding protein
MTDSSAVTKILVDTNIYVYAADPEAGDKNARAFNIIRDLVDRKQLVVSAQVLNEFYHASTRPNKPPSLSHNDAAQTIRDLVASVPVMRLNSSTTLLALDAIPIHGFSFWDALIWAAAKENGIPVIYTGDFQHGREIEGVRIINPFLDHS